MNSQINKVSLVDDLMGKVGTEKTQGEEQKKLDVYANKIFIVTIKKREKRLSIEKKSAKNAQN